MHQHRPGRVNQPPPQALDLRSIAEAGWPQLDLPGPQLPQAHNHCLESALAARDHHEATAAPGEDTLEREPDCCRMPR